MYHPRFRLPLITACGMLVVLANCDTMQVRAAPARALNLLIIQTDEHHYGTLGCYGGKIVGTPHIDWIAEQGAICTSFYATTPVCSPSRAALVSGLYPQNTQVVKNNVPLSDAVITFAELLRRRRYATGYAGKWHLNGTGKPQWAPERQFGFQDNRFMFNRGHWKKLIDTPQGPRVGARNKNGPSYALDGADEESFTTDWLCNKAVDFIREHQNEPFCYMVSLPDPHGPNSVRAPYDTMYAGVDVPIPATLEKQPAQTARWGRSAGVTAAQLRKMMPLYYGMVKCIDDNVGKLLDTLRALELIDHTIVVFTSDHGDLCGEHGRLNKGVPYEGSARIPFLVYCPDKIDPGSKVTEALSCIDFLPTVMRLMDVPVEHYVDGRDASGLLMKKVSAWNDIAFLRSTAGRTPWLSVVTAKYKLTFSAEDRPWFVDLQQDPSELVNLFAGDQHQAVIRDLTRQLVAYCQQHHDDYARVPQIHEEIAMLLEDAPAGK